MNRNETPGHCHSKFATTLFLWFPYVDFHSKTTCITKYSICMNRNWYHSKHFLLFMKFLNRDCSEDWLVCVCLRPQNGKWMHRESKLPGVTHSQIMQSVAQILLSNGCCALCKSHWFCHKWSHLKTGGSFNYILLIIKPQFSRATL